MSTERDEIRLTIHAANCLERVHGEYCTYWDDDAASADVILAAGYRKPRTITTIAELEALPVGAIVLDGEGEVARKLTYGWRVLVSESGFDAWLSDSLEETYLPATVLHTPEGEN